jgi:hypothetical protein
MAGVTATISELRIENQQLHGTVSVDGDPGGVGVAVLAVYDAAGAQRFQSDLGNLAVGESWDLHLDVEGGSLEDGDYGAWIFVTLLDTDGAPVEDVQSGVSFLVGRGEVYPSREAVDERRHDDDPVQASNLRIEGSWIVFDMTNPMQYDVEVAHELSITKEFDQVHRAQGEELVRAGGTHQGHYILPERMADGRYSVMVIVQAKGGDYQSLIDINVDVNQEVVTVVS